VNVLFPQLHQFSDLALLCVRLIVAVVFFESGRRQVAALVFMLVMLGAIQKKFSGKYEFRVIKGGIGHNLPQEAPQAFAQAVIDADGFARRKQA
jgi:hypothetical protein